ncbi:MAG: AAA family ATPase [bacterium]|nr:AAA family ATPase [bacterium]
MAARLSKLTLRGFKTIRDLTDFEPGPLTVLIGPNGAGKSNFISFFRMLSWSLVPPGQLRDHVGQSGGASTLLHDGPEVTREIEAELTIETEAGRNDYAFRLVWAAGDTLIYTSEKYRFSRSGYPSLASWTELGAGHSEAELIHRSESEEITAKTIHVLLRRCILYQFHNTSWTSRIRTKWDEHDGRWLKEDAGNLAPFLYRLRNEEPKYYRRIVETIRLTLPFFADFELEPEHGRLLLRWREHGSDVVFSAAQAADGMLRTMALVALLLQPERDLPDVLILDEPELGLHPYAINIVAGLLRAAAEHSQVILATQSVALLDQFEPQDVVVVSRAGRESSFGRLDPDDLHDWLEEYSLAELWEKNVLGGRPSVALAEAAASR